MRWCCWKETFRFLINVRRLKFFWVDSMEMLSIFLLLCLWYFQRHSEGSCDGGNDSNQPCFQLHSGFWTASRKKLLITSQNHKFSSGFHSNWKLKTSPREARDSRCAENLPFSSKLNSPYVAIENRFARRHRSKGKKSDFYEGNFFSFLNASCARKYSGKFHTHIFLF